MTGACLLSQDGRCSTEYVRLPANALRQHCNDNIIDNHVIHDNANDDDDDDDDDGDDNVTNDMLLTMQTDNRVLNSEDVILTRRKVFLVPNTCRGQARTTVAGAPKKEGEQKQKPVVL